jgi:hypothetical protein
MDEPRAIPKVTTCFTSPESAQKKSPAQRTEESVSGECILNYFAAAYFLATASQFTTWKKAWI